MGEVVAGGGKGGVEARERKFVSGVEGGKRVKERERTCVTGGG